MCNKISFFISVYIVLFAKPAKTYINCKPNLLDCTAKKQNYLHADLSHISFPSAVTLFLCFRTIIVFVFVG